MVAKCKQNWYTSTSKKPEKITIEKGVNKR